MQDQTEKNQKLRLNDIGGTENTRNSLSLSGVRNFFYSSIAGLVLFCLSFPILPYLVSEANAEVMNTYINWGSVSLTLDPDVNSATTSIGENGHGDILFGDITPTSADSEDSYGTLMVLKKTIGIETSGKYYTVFLSMPGNNPNLNYTSSTGTDTKVKIPSTSASFSSPAKFSSSSWGFAVPGVEATGIDDAPSTFVAPSLIGSQITSASSSADAKATYNNTTWAGFSLNEDEKISPIQIWKNSTEDNTGFSSGDTFDVYYGIAVDTSVVAGTYENKIVYTALASAASLDSVSKNLLVSEEFGGEGTTQTVRFDLVESVDAIKESSLTIYMIPHSEMVAANYTLDSFKTSDLENPLTSYPVCNIIEGSLTFSSYAEVKCETPKLSVDGVYDYILNISGYNYTYASVAKYESTPVGAFIYAGLQTTYSDSTSRNGKKVVSKMQDMTGSICRNTNEWGTGTGDDATIYDYNGEKLVNGTATGNALLEPGIDTIGISSFTLTDTRDSKPYLVRRLADGNCWMVQNLDLGLSTVGTLTPEDSDVASNWTPDENVAEAEIYQAAKARMRVQNNMSFYNWYAATAENGTVSSENEAVDESICAKGWSLPNRDGERSFKKLLNDEVYGLIIGSGPRGQTDALAKIETLPFSIHVDGMYYANSSSQGVYHTNDSIFWLNYALNNGAASCMYFTTSDYLHPNDRWGKPTLGLVRCVARD